jgi:fibronectin type 3 domain-containing protein
VLGWTAVSGATSYNLYYSTTSGVTPANGTKISGLTSSSYTQTGLTNGTTYYYVVTAVGTGGESAASNQASATPVAPAPGAPTNLTATAGNAQVVLGWTGVSGAASYNLYYSTTTGVTPANGTKVSGLTTAAYTQTGLTNGTTYYYVVTAVGSGGESAASNQASATPVAPFLPPTLSVTPGNGQAVASWTAATGATSYNLYYSTTSPVAISTATKVGSISGTTYTVTGLNNCTPYYFAVTAVSGTTETALSNQVTASPVSATSVALTPGTAGSLTLAANSTTSLTFSFPANAVSQNTTVSLTPYTQAQLTVPFTQTVTSFITGFGVCVVPSTSAFTSPVTVSGTVSSSIASGTQLNLAALQSGAYTNTATFLVGASGAITEGLPSVSLPGLTAPGTFALYQPVSGTNTTIANYGIAIYADDSTALTKNGLNIVHFYDTHGNLLTTPVVQFLAIAGSDLDGQGLTPDASVGTLVDGSNLIHFITGIQNGAPQDTGVTLNVSAYGGDGDSIVGLPNGDEAIATADDGGPLVYISGILSGSPVIASTISKGTGSSANFRDGLVISNDGKVMLARGGTGVDVYSITPITPTAGTLAGTVSHKFTLITTLSSANNSVLSPILEDGRDAMAISPVDSTRALVGGTNSSFTAASLQLITGLPSAPVAATPFNLPSSTPAFYPAAVAISPDGTLAVVGAGFEANGLYLFSGVNTGNLTLVGKLYDPNYTLPIASEGIAAGSSVQMGGISTVGFSLDGKYVIAGDVTYRALLVIPVSASGFGAAPSLVYIDPNVGIPYNDQMIIH